MAAFVSSLIHLFYWHALTSCSSKPACSDLQEEVRSQSFFYSLSVLAHAVCAI